jgi:hypothetical protein
MSYRTETWVNQRGFEYTGWSERNAETLKPRLETIKKDGFTGYIVRWSSGDGYSVYACKKWVLNRNIQDMTKELTEHIPADRKYLLNQHEKDMANLTDRENRMKSELEMMKKELLGMEQHSA